MSGSNLNYLRLLLIFRLRFYKITGTIWIEHPIFRFRSAVLVQKEALRLFCVSGSVEGNLSMCPAHRSVGQRSACVLPGVLSCALKLIQRRKQAQVCIADMIPF